MRHFAWLLVGLLIVAMPADGAGKKAPTAPTDDEIRALIDQLVSPNPPPITGVEDKREAPEYRLPPGFDRKKQSAVHQARLKLRKLGPRAFPLLMERWDDDRYCCTCSNVISGFCFNQSVGKVCQTIIFDQLQPYGYWPKPQGGPRNKPMRPQYPATFLDSKVNAKNWWAANKDQPLRQLQLSVVDWVIAEEAKAPQNYPAEETEQLQKIRRSLMQGNEPLPAGHYGLSDIEE